MASRARGQEWNPMRDDFDNTNYEPQYGDEDTGHHVKLNHKRLYVRNVPVGLNTEGLQAAFAQYGKLVDVYMSPHPEKRYALISFETAGEARLAMTKLNRTEPLRLTVNIAHDTRGRPKTYGEKGESNSRYQEREKEDDCSSIVSHNRNAKRQEDLSYGDNNIMADQPIDNDEDLNLDCTDPELQLELAQLKIEKLKLQEAQIEIKQKMLQRQANERRKMTAVTRSVLPGGKVVLKPTAEGNPERRDHEPETNFIAGAGDSNDQERICCWDHPDSDIGSSAPSSCSCCSCNKRNLDRAERNKDVPSKKDRYYDRSERPDYRYEEKRPERDYIYEERRFDYGRNEGERCHYDGNRSPERCEDKQVFRRVSCKKEAAEKRSRYDHYDHRQKFAMGKTNNLASKKSEYEKYQYKRSEVNNKKRDQDNRKMFKRKSDDDCELKFVDFYDSEEEKDETNKLIQLRNSDYMDIVDDNLKIVVALPGYPKSKICLRHMDSFQKCLTDIINMQLKSGLVKKVPTFMDYYLNRGAIVCICKDIDTRDWMVRVSPGLQERMSINLILLQAKVKRLCLAVLKIPQSCWPASAQDAFKLLQYFNPTLKTESWQIYSQKIVGDIECTSFMIDRVSGEIIRGPTFNNIIDYNQIEFELTGYIEIYYECFLSDLEDLSSVASRVKLLEEMKSQGPTPRNQSNISIATSKKFESESNLPKTDERNIDQKHKPAETSGEKLDVKSQLQCTLQRDVLKKLKDVDYVGGKDEIIIWSDETACSDQEEKNDCMKTDNDYEYFSEDKKNAVSISGVAVSEKTESVYESNDNLTTRNSSLNIDSNRGIAYHRRTNYLYVENQLKVAITLEGYPQNKLEGTHIRRLKHLFKEYLHKDMKNQRFANLIIPKFQDVYLSNGAVIYICDSLETKDYLTEVLPKFINSTGLKLTFKDIKELVRYTRTIMRLPKEHAHVESVEILLKLQAKYPKLKPDCWKYYSDVAGKQKRQFGVEPESLEVIKSPDFDPTYEGDKIIFRIIDRKKRDVSFEEPTTTETDLDAVENPNAKKIRETVTKSMYVAIDPELMNAPLAKIRANHYSDLIPDDLKLYVGPLNYPESRIDDTLFHSIRRAVENFVRDAVERGEMNEESMPRFHDMYLFDGVIFIICQNMFSRHWIEHILATINSKLHVHLKCTEFRGAVGIISMVVKTNKGIDEIVEILQKQNPRLRTKYWRKISTVRTKTKLDVVLQIDKLSAQVMTSENFNKFIGSNSIHFKLGHLQSMIKPKSSLEELAKIHAKKPNVAKPTSEIKLESKSKSKVCMQGPRDKTFEEIKNELKDKYPSLRIDVWDVLHERKKGQQKISELEIDEESAKIIEKEDCKLCTDDGKLYFYTGLASNQSDEDLSIEIESQKHPENNQVSAEQKETPHNTDTKPLMLEDSNKTLSNSSVLMSEMSNSQTLRNSSTDVAKSSNQTLCTDSMLPQQSNQPNSRSSIVMSNQNNRSLLRRGSVLPEGSVQDLHKMILKIPVNILPDNKEDLSIIFDLLEDKNPGLNTELWQVYHDSPYPNNGRFTIMSDKQSAAIVQGKNFDPTIGGEKLRFYF